MQDAAHRRADDRRLVIAMARGDREHVLVVGGSFPPLLGHVDAALTLDTEKPKKGNANLSLARAASFRGDDEPRVLFHGFEELHREFIGSHFPIGHHRAEHLVHRDVAGDLNACEAGSALSYLHIDFGIDGRGVFAEPEELRE